MPRLRLRSASGQVAAEYVGGLLLIAVVIAGVPEAHDAGDDPADDPDRDIHDAECDNDLPGDLVRGEGDDPSGDPEADAVYDNLGQVFDYYSATFGRDSYDDSGADLVASINFCETPGHSDAQRALGRDPDGVRRRLCLEPRHHRPRAHARRHGAHRRLEYQCQSGALNESMSDNFAANVDRDDWEIGEDLPGGAIRDMADPGNGDPPQPAHTDDFDEMPNDGNPYNDHGGAHYNSGIPNHAYYLMVRSIGRDAAEQTVYRALTEKLEPDSGFEDLRTASLEVARELWGEDSPEYEGIDESLAAVGLDGTWEAPEVEGC